MLNYNTQLTARPPVGEAQRADMLSGMRKPTPFPAYGRNHRDVLGALADTEASKLNVQAQRADADFNFQRQQAQDNLVLQGLQQLSAAQQNDADFANSRLNTVLGFVNPLLRGLYQ